MKGLGVMWFDKVILLSCAEKGGDKALINMIDRLQIIQVKSGLFVDSFLNE